jgi:hypothetical protein
MPIKIKAVESFSRTGFIGFCVAILIFFFSNVKINWEDPWSDGAFRFVCYFIVIASVLIIGVDRPNVSKFFKALYEALSDGKLTAEEQIGLVRLAFGDIMQWWADMTQGVSAKEKQTEETLPEPPK